MEPSQPCPKYSHLFSTCGSSTCWTLGVTALCLGRYKALHYLSPSLALGSTAFGSFPAADSTPSCSCTYREGFGARLTCRSLLGACASSSGVAQTRFKLFFVNKTNLKG